MTNLMQYAETPVNTATVFPFEGVWRFDGNEPGKCILPPAQGMTFREHAALGMMRELACFGDRVVASNKRSDETEAQVVARWAVELADALIAELAKP